MAGHASAISAARAGVENGGRVMAMHGDHRRKLAVGFAAAGVVFGALVASGGCHRQVTANAVEKAMNADPSVARYMAAMKETFPDDYQRVLATAAGDANGGATTEQARANGFAISQGLVAKHVRDIARAPDGDLQALMRAQAALLNHVDDGLCARLFLGGLRPTDTLPDDAKPLMADVSVANLRAARAGIDHPQTRPAQVQPADADALRGGVKAAGLSDARLAIFTGGGLMSASPADQCAIGRAVDGAIVALPPATAGRLAATALGSG
jgi:hypothetical protein